MLLVHKVLQGQQDQPGHKVYKVLLGHKVYKVLQDLQVAKEIQVQLALHVRLLL